jgi:hypothetical protein
VDDREGERVGVAGWVMTDALLMDMVYVGCGVIFGLIVRKLVVTYCKRPWVGLTDEDWIIGKRSADYIAGAEWAEAKLKEKNS